MGKGFEHVPFSLLPFFPFPLAARTEPVNCTGIEEAREKSEGQFPFP